MAEHVGIRVERLAHLVAVAVGALDVQLDERPDVREVLQVLSRHVGTSPCDQRNLVSRAVSYVAAADRYDAMQYRRCGRSGLRLPLISLGLWHNFGHDRPFAVQRNICPRAFDVGITHFDLANNYGPPYGAAEENFGRLMATDLAGHRDELVISTKAGYDMWPGPYGEWGSRKYLLASLDQSLAPARARLRRHLLFPPLDPDTRLDETMGALKRVSQGKALYVGISSYSSETLDECRSPAAGATRFPCCIHQPSYSMFNRWPETDRFLDTLEGSAQAASPSPRSRRGSPTDRYLHGIPPDSRVATGGARCSRARSPRSGSPMCAALDRHRRRRGQTLARTRIGVGPARSTDDVAHHRRQQCRTADDNVNALAMIMSLTADELTKIDSHAVDEHINLWAASSDV